MRLNTQSITLPVVWPSLHTAVLQKHTDLLTRCIFGVAITTGYNQDTPDYFETADGQIVESKF